MRRPLILTLAAALLTTTAWLLHGTAAGSTHPATPAAAVTGTPTNEHALERGLPTTHPARAPLDPAPATPAGGGGDPLAVQLARARLATAKYATSLAAARADGYQLLTRMLPDMGWHFHNPTLQGFDPTKPPILVYEHPRGRWQLAALEWVFTTTPTSPPLPGASYGAFPAACHYHDGTLVVARVQQLCPTRSPRTRARFSLWHPDLVTLHLWLWYPNPAGLHHSTNPLVRPYNHP